MIVDNKRQPAALPSSVSLNSEYRNPESLNSVSRTLRSVFVRTSASFMRTTDAFVRTNDAFMSTNASLVHTNASKPLVSQLTRLLSNTPFVSTSDAFMSTNASLMLASHLIEPQSLLRCRLCQTSAKPNGINQKQNLPTQKNTVSPRFPPGAPKSPVLVPRGVWGHGSSTALPQRTCSRNAAP
jgi:hypothetical protein